jgi:hypothetical protein
MNWIWLLSLPLQTANASVPLVINVEPEVVSVTLDCPNGAGETKKPEKGQVQFDVLPKDCSVLLTQSSGAISGTGEWVCNSRGCLLEVPPHKPIEDANGRVNLIFLDSGNASSIQINCTGYRQRSAIEDYTVVFNDVPIGECTVYAKGGSSAKSQPLTWGTYACTISGPTLICQKYKR